jgi:hypothetical protein
VTNVTRFSIAFLALACGLPLGACHTGARTDRTGQGGDAVEPAQPSVDDVVLTDRDLAPMDGFVRRRRWILGDDVEVVASKEYFAPILSITERIGSVRREDTVSGSDAVIVLAYEGPGETIDVQTAPRVLIGTGLSVMARRRLVVRLAKTTDANLPVRLEVRASGKASTGVASQVAQRGEALSIHALLRRSPQGGYVFEGS